MCNCMSKGSSHHSGQCGNPCFSLGPFRATSTLCPPANMGSIIPFSSGNVPVILETFDNGLVDKVSAIGFGTATTGITIAGNIINLPLSGVTAEAFSVPRAGKITAISASFTELYGLEIGLGEVIVRAQVYRAPAGSNAFTATNAFVDLGPVATGIVAVGTTYQATANISNVPVSAGDRLLMVFSTFGTNVNTIIGLTGATSAGITIS